MRHVSAHDATCRSFNLQCHQQTPAASAPPLFRGMWASINRELEVEKREGGPMKWEAQAVRCENRQRQMSLPIFSRSFFLHRPLMPVTPRLPPPPPSCPNASRRWFFSSFRHDSHHHHLPRVPTRAGGGFFCSFDPSPTTTSLASKREPEVVSFVLPTRLPPPPPPSRSNASWRWFFRLFRPSATTTTSLMSKHELEVVSSTILTACHHTTSLAFKCKLEVVFFVVSTVCHHYHLPRVQMRAGGGHFYLFQCDSG